MSAAHQERRQGGERRPICLPVKIVFLGQRLAPGGRLSTSMKAAPVARGSASFPIAGRVGSNPPSAPSEPPRSDAPPALEELPLHALAVDVSPNGIQIEVSGSAGRRFREDDEMQPRLEVRFLNEELREHSPRPGRVRWSHQDGRQALRLGLQFEIPLGPDALQAVLWAGQSHPPQRRWLRDCIVGLVSVAVASVAWHQAYRSESTARERALADSVASDNAAEQARSEALACATERAAERTERRPAERVEARTLERPEARAAERPEGVVDAGASASVPARDAGDATPVHHEELVRKLVEHAFRQVDGGPDAPGEE
jgi:hypothetical protein